MNIEAAVRPKRRGLGITTFAMTFALLGGAAAGVSAQHTGHYTAAPRTSGHLVVLGGETNPGSVSVMPRSGTVGTEIKLTPKGLPANAQIQIMMGALRDGFEVVQTATTDEGGRIRGQDTVRIEVPEWVKTDRPYLVMITDLSYNPLAAADMFHPTSAEGTLVRRGTVTYQDPSCPMLTSEGGEIYFLVGNTTGIIAGKDMVFRGKVVDDQRCGKTTTIEVRSATFPPK
jgi:hypothetical protein